VRNLRIKKDNLVYLATPKKRLGKHVLNVKMKALLVRIGIDSTAGNWVAPVDMLTNKFVYVPIPESGKQENNLRIKIGYEDFIQSVKLFCEEYSLDYINDLNFPLNLEKKYVHLDPDFENLTYGDNGSQRGKGLRNLAENDLILFYSSLKPINTGKNYLTYALIGIFTVDKTVPAKRINKNKQLLNAHTRKINISENDLVVFAKKGFSGRFDKCIPIGEYRNRAYRVKSDILEDWGGLNVRDGYIQRSINPPSFTNPDKFLNWFKNFEIKLKQKNN
jgi:hypothetical protein